ncbi:lipoteichoic acid synthase-like YqgS [Pullulanibacillus camelliae]|uniref:Lipoteichoic acid synthase-like YqgS n=1 Tax=Pullulanibacillus camelliae TaxID=1707096 RepID=A0A8J2VWK5_9BACL|nr:LTA synthase family protein [Pullulanibacillus camelliae]GGE39565.1 lipoteichoic acid synthase-like YqgS [Pullulanibacillus camelliae]
MQYSQLQTINPKNVVWLTIFCFWLKSYLAFLFEFHLDIENNVQGFILLISPLSTAFFFFGCALLFNGRLFKLYTGAFTISFTVILYANIIYHRFFNDFLTVPDLMQFKNFSQLGNSTQALMAPHDFLYWLDTLCILSTLFIMKTNDRAFDKKINISSMFIIAGCLFLFNLSLAEGQRPQLLSRGFDRAKLVKLLGLYNYHIYDMIMNIRTSSQKAFADDSDTIEVENYVKANYTPPNPNLFGIAKHKNVILVSLESTQNFLIHYKLHGEEVTPFLNQLTSDTFYFDHFYHNTGQGKTSDAEFLIDNALYPLPRGAVYTTNAHNHYQALPHILDKSGYTSVVFHGNHKSFWNRDIMYATLGYDHFYSEKDFHLTEKNTINYGLKDKAFFKQAVPKLARLKQPFYAKFILLSNHFPFLLDHGEASLKRADTGDGVVNRYFQTARYQDEALRYFFQRLKDTGLYDQSVVILYGDHYGISDNHNPAMASVLGEDKITAYSHYKLQKVPLFIHIPNLDGASSHVMHTTGGEVDLRPTILHLLGLSTDHLIGFGADLFSNKRKSFTVQRDGSAISDRYLYAANVHQCYKQPTGEKVAMSNCLTLKEAAHQDLILSDHVVYGDLLRFLRSPSSEKN